MFFRTIAKLAGLGTIVVVVLVCLAFFLGEPQTGEFGIAHLGPRLRDQGIVFGINNHGDMVGSGTDGTVPLAVFWSIQDCRQESRLLVGLHTARGINNLDQVAGSVLVQGEPVAVLRHLYGEKNLVRIGVKGVACDVNDLGQAVGCYLNHRRRYSAFLWDPKEGMRDLNRVIGVSIASANGINNAGQIVGVTVQGRAFLWTPNLGMVDLGTDGDEHSCANGINNFGHVVGHFTVSGRQRAFLWSVRAGRVEVDRMLPPGCQCELISADDINDYGQIIAHGQFTTARRPDSRFHQFLLSMTSPALEQWPAHLQISALTPSSNDDRPAK